MSNYIPNTDMQQLQMLQDIGVDNINDLFSDIPENVKLKSLLIFLRPCQKLSYQHICDKWLIKTITLKNIPAWCWGV